MDGMVFWVTGLPGSGKTTLGEALFYRLKEKHKNVVILDGNIVKNIVSTEEVSYTHEGRKARARQYANLCKILSDQGIIVICCTVSLYHEIQQWNRKNLSDYMEILIEMDEDILYERNHKGLYPDRNIRMQVEFPETPDIVLYNTMDNRMDEFVDKILKNTPEIKSSNKQHKAYWDSYYKKDIVTRAPSGFAQFAATYMKKGHQLIELGCGNGRDSIFFAQNGIKTTSIDLSSTAIDLVKQHAGELAIFAVCDDFVKSKVLFSIEYDYCYSRWTMHSIDEEQQEELLENVYNALRPDGLFFIEARTIHDDIYGKGETIGSDAYIYDGHYRRFLTLDKLMERLKSKGFSIEHSEEGRGFSKTEESDPVLLRIVARKNPAKL